MEKEKGQEAGQEEGLRRGGPAPQMWGEGPRKRRGHGAEKEAVSSPSSGSEREREVAQSCPTLCDPMDCSLPGSSVHGVFQARVLEWIAISFAKGSSQPRNRTQVSFKQADALLSEPPGKP